MDKYNFDVVVAGGGPSGIAAAVAAAREGCSVALIERYGILGGMLTSGHVHPILGSTSENTMYQEIVNLLTCKHKDYSIPKTRNGREVSVDSEEAKYLLLKLAVENNVKVFLQSTVVGVIKENNRVIGLTVGTAQGIEEFYAKVTVDATGDGFVAFSSGAEYKIGRENDGRCQPISVEFTLEGVDEERAILCYGGSDPVTLPSGEKYSDFCKAACAKGVLPENVQIVRLHKTLYSGERQVNATQVNGCNTLAVEELVMGELTARSQIPVIVSFLKNNIPGYENCRVKSSGSTIGVRETRRIIGEYVISDQDVENGTRFEDVVVHKAWFLIDIHNPNGGGQAEKHSQPATPYDIPLRSLIPIKIDGLITAGRCISGTHRAHASYRVMGVAMSVGQAAGIAAALSAKRNVQPRELSCKYVQDSLISMGVDLFSE